MHATVSRMNNINTSSNNEYGRFYAERLEVETILEAEKIGKTWYGLKWERLESGQPVKLNSSC